jgi:hypothetical protein
MTQQQHDRPIYRARPDLEGSHLAARRTEDPKVVRLVQRVRWAGGYSEAFARRIAA